MRKLSALVFAGALWLAAPHAFAQNQPTTIVTLPASAGWTDTGVQVRRGGQLQITAGGGRWAAAPPRPSAATAAVATPQATADGYPNTAGRTRGVILPGANYGALIGRIGPNGPPFLIGSRHQSIASMDGPLLVAMNDVPNQFADNVGQMTIRIGFTPPPPATAPGQRAPEQRAPGDQTPTQRPEGVENQPQADATPADPSPAGQRDPGTARPPPPASAPGAQAPDASPPRAAPEASSEVPGEPPDAPPETASQGAVVAEDSAPPAAAETPAGPTLDWPILGLIGGGLLLVLGLIALAFRGRAPSGGGPRQPQTRISPSAEISARVKDNGVTQQVVRIRVAGGAS